MHRHLKVPTLKMMSSFVRTIVLPVVLCFSSLAALLTISSAQTKTYSTPLSGPELPGPIVKPGLSPPADDAVDQEKPADYAYGAFQRGYYLTALKLALPRAESGDPAAQTLIAELYWRGLGVGKDQKEGARWYAFAADAGGREAQFAYGNILLRGKVVEQDKERGETYLRKAADAGHARASFNLAQIMTARRPTWATFKKALPYYTVAAKAGVPDAQYALANIHAEAKGVLVNDELLARKWLEKSARAGFDSAQVDLAIWLANGRGGKQDLEQALFWFGKAATGGNVVAQNRLARMYAFGTGVPADPIRAGAWHILARRAGFADTEMDRRFQSLSEINRKRALEAANQLATRLRR